MCSGAKNKVNPSEVIMENGFKSESGGFLGKYSLLLELSASDDLEGLKTAVEEGGLGLDEASFWYGRRLGSRKMGFEERTPLMIASMYGSKRVLKYVIDSGRVEVNRPCGSDRATALHCAAAAGASDSSLEVVRLLLGASADPNAVTSYGSKPVDLLAHPGPNAAWNSKRKAVETLLRGEEEAVLGVEEEELTRVATPPAERKEYPVDVLLPDINNGVYGTDDFRMYSFKIKPCSRAYSHDWTECPFVHPGENARRRDPRKYPYSCVPCPEFRKGTCQKNDACEYAHGVFESWLHPAQYRTRLCKDETGCNRKVCFFAHRTDELRPVYASTGSAMPSPRSNAQVPTMDMAALSLTPPMTPISAASSPKSGGLWQQQQGKSGPALPALQLPGSRLKTALCARDFDLEMEFLGLDNQANTKQQQLLEEISRISSPSCFSRMAADLKPTNLDDMFGSQIPISSPTGLQMRQNMAQLRASYPASAGISLPSPMRKPTSYGIEQQAASASAMAAAVMSSRAAAFKQRSQSFVDRGANHLGFTAAANSVGMSSSSSSNFSDWSSPEAKSPWAVQGDELNKLRKSASFGFRNRNNSPSPPRDMEEPDVSWVSSLVKDVPAEKQHYHHHYNRGAHESLPPWVEQLYIEQEQLVA